MPPVSSQLHAKPKSASSFGWRQMAGSAEQRFPQWCCTSSPTQRPAAGWGLVLLSSFLSQPACRSHSYDCTVTSACWDHLPHEVDEENCNHRLAGIKNCLVLNSLSLTAVLGSRILIPFFFPNLLRTNIQAGPSLWRASSMHPSFSRSCTEIHYCTPAQKKTPSH